MSSSRGPGRLVALEGIDGTGKSTLQRRLARRLRASGWRVVLWREPTDPRLGRRAQELARRDPLGGAVGFTVDRLLARPTLLEALARADVVLSDRSFYSTLAYQGSALPPAPRRALARLQRGVTVPPDRVLWLELPAAEALRRVGRRGNHRAPLERLRTLRRVARAYAGFARAGRWWVLDARRSRTELADGAYERLAAWLPPPRRPRRRAGA